jgi:hypothetical protein
LAVGITTINPYNSDDVEIMLDDGTIALGWWGKTCLLWAKYGEDGEYQFSDVGNFTVTAWREVSE